MSGAPVDSVVAALAASEVLHNLSVAGRQGLAAAGSPVGLARGALLCRAGDPGDAVFIVLDGQIEARMGSAEGREMRLVALGPGQIVGEMAALDGGRRSADIVAATRCRLWRIPRVALLQAIEAEPKVAVALIVELSRRLRAVNGALEAEILLDLGGRLARLLLVEQGGRGVVALTQTEMARRLVASREKVNRKLHEWARHGWVEIASGGVRLTDVARLRALTGGLDAR
jgi:CRP/FNR family cyclic AMP-dependent transcriptional regulator